VIEDCEPVVPVWQPPRSSPLASETD